MKRRGKKYLLVECAICNSRDIQIKGMVKYYLHTICLSCGLDSANMIMNDMDKENISNNVQIIRRQNIPRLRRRGNNYKSINYTKH